MDKPVIAKINIRGAEVEISSPSVSRILKFEKDRAQIGPAEATIKLLDDVCHINGETPSEVLTTQECTRVVNIATGSGGVDEDPPST